MGDNGVRNEEQHRAAIKGAAAYLYEIDLNQRERGALLALEKEIERAWGEIERLNQERDAVIAAGADERAALGAAVVDRARLMRESMGEERAREVAAAVGTSPGEILGEVFNLRKIVALTIGRLRASESPHAKPLMTAIERHLSGDYEGALKILAARGGESKVAVPADAWAKITNAVDMWRGKAFCRGDFIGEVCAAVDAARGGDVPAGCVECGAPVWVLSPEMQARREALYVRTGRKLRPIDVCETHAFARVQRALAEDDATPASTPEPAAERGEDWLAQGDLFGTEGQLDPRGDRRD